MVKYDFENQLRKIKYWWRTRKKKSIISTYNWLFFT